MFREMVRKKQQLTKEEAIELLKKEPRGVLSLLGDDGYPYGVPIDHWYNPEDGKLYFQNMFSFNAMGMSMKGNYYGTLSEDGKTIALEDENPNTGHSGFGPAASQSDAPLVLTVEGNTLKVASAYSGYVENYVAVNPDMDLGGEEEEPAAGWDGPKTYSASRLYYVNMATSEEDDNASVTIEMDVDADGVPGIVI